MITGPARFRAGAALFVAAASLLAAPGAALGTGTPTPTPDVTGAGPPSGPVAVSLTDVEPHAPQPGDRLVVTGSLQNVSRRAVTSLQVQLEISADILHSRSELGSYLAGQGPFGNALPQTAVAPDGGRLAAGARAAFRLTVPVDTLSLPVTGAYELGVEVTGTTANGSGPVGGLRTFLPWAPLGTVQPTPVVWLWPLVDRPHQSVGPEFTDDTLAAELAPTGRLGELLAVGARYALLPARAARPGVAAGPGGRPRGRAADLGQRPVPLSWAVDPLLVDSVRAMAGGYKVVPAGGRPRRGTGQLTARSFLAGLRTALPAGEVVALPYADPDLVALVRAGLAGEVAAAIRRAASALPADLGVQPLAGVVWPPGGQVDRHTANELVADGSTALLLDSTALPLVSQPNYTPSARAALPTPHGSVPVVLADDTISAVVDAGAADPADARLAEQRFLAETLLIDTELPFTARPLLVMPDRRWAPSPGYAAGLLSDTATVPWLDPVPLSQVLTDPPATGAREPLRYPAASRAEELPGDYLATLAGLRDALSSFEQILLTRPDRDALAQGYETALLLLGSAGWRGNSAGRHTAQQAVATALTSTRNSVQIVSSGLTTLTGRGGTIPITVANNLTEPVRVVVYLNAGARARIEQAGSITVELPPATRTQLPVHMTAQTAGVFRLVAMLRTTSGVDYSPPVLLLVRSTVYGTVALAITIAALAVLCVALAVRAVRRVRDWQRRRARHARA